MKKTLLLLTSLLTLSNYSQVLQSDNFNSLTVGNVSTSIAGTTAGQGGFYTFTAAGANSDFQIVSEPGYGNVLQLTGSNTASNSRFLWRDGLATAWSSRTSGNNVIQVEYFFFTGGASTSKNRVALYLYNSDGTKILAGLTMEQDTKRILGVANYDNAGTVGNYSFNLGASGAAVNLTPNTWVNVGFTFNKTTGEVIWRGPGFYAGVPGAAAGFDPDELDFIMTAGTGNTASSTGKYDSYMVRAVPSESLLSVEDIATIDTNFNIYPNPAKDILNFSADLNIKKIEIIDVNGRIVLSEQPNLTNGTVNVQNLNSGVYLMNVTSENNSTSTKKFIKQ